MGALLSSVHKEVTASNNEIDRTTNELLTSLWKRVDERLELFYQNTTNATRDTLLLPIDKVLDKVTFTRAVISTDTQDSIGNIIDTIVAGFDRTLSAKGLGQMAKGVIASLIGMEKGEMLEETKYSIQLNDVNGLGRLDILFLAYNTESQSIVTRTTAIVGCCVVFSSVDAKNVDSNAIRNVIGKCFGSLPRALQEIIAADFYWNVTRASDPKELTEDEKKKRTEDTKKFEDAYADWEKEVGEKKKAIEEAKPKDDSKPKA